jgi:hypothetical protein
MNIPQLAQSFANEKGRPDYHDFYYTTKIGVAAEVQRNAAIARMKDQEWWHEHIKIHGEEPKLPIVINKRNDQ